MVSTQGVDRLVLKDIFEILFVQHNKVEWIIGAA